MKKLTIFSFGFKYRRPPANNYFDVSFIKNPARDKRWNLFSEVDYEMEEFILKQLLVKEFISNVCSLILLLRKVDDDCRVAFGCSAGRHRSPIIAKAVANELAIEHDIGSVMRNLEKEKGYYGVL